MRPNTADDYLKYPTLKEEMVQFNEKVKVHVGVFNGDTILQTEPDNPEESHIVTNGEADLPDEEDAEDNPDGRGFDPMIRAEVILPHKEGDMVAVVQGRKRDANGHRIGCRHYLGFTSSYADGDVWMCKASKPTGEIYYESMLMT
jgi:hypothetical protein